MDKLERESLHRAAHAKLLSVRRLQHEIHEGMMRLLKEFHMADELITSNEDVHMLKQEMLSQILTSYFLSGVGDLYALDFLRYDPDAIRSVQRNYEHLIRCTLTLSPSSQQKECHSSYPQLALLLLDILAWKYPDMLFSQTCQQLLQSVLQELEWFGLGHKRHRLDLLFQCLAHCQHHCPHIFDKPSVLSHVLSTAYVAGDTQGLELFEWLMQWKSQLNKEAVDITNVAFLSGTADSNSLLQHWIGILDSLHPSKSATHSFPSLSLSNFSLPLCDADYRSSLFVLLKFFDNHCCDHRRSFRSDVELACCTIQDITRLFQHQQQQQQRSSMSLSDLHYIHDKDVITAINFLLKRIVFRANVNAMSMSMSMQCQCQCQYQYQ
ncbi:hypothetical protein RFI_12789 [Reticulomyxa filosa]|uniref:Uncharacterized protein n=1 Tax=Reticulomyxa filosa TaxID=46433 RepID=X6NGB9_RETFI|nr:hypothetical protein RFI_12789 [Reticulomyxa filosa]|eukprot:ETO24367.1 hypothetical protein RFI_12789 [Reticulomyxa filosa]